MYACSLTISKRKRLLLPACFISSFFLDSCDTAYPLTINRQKSSQSDHWQYQRAAVQLAIRFLPADSTPIPQRLLNCFSRFVSGIAEPTKEITPHASLSNVLQPPPWRIISWVCEVFSLFPT